MAEVGQSESWDEGESREAQALQVHGWPPRVADFFSFVLWAPRLPHLVTAVGREGFKVAKQSECGDSPGKNTGVGCNVLLQGIFPTQQSNRCLQLGKRILYH